MGILFWPGISEFSYQIQAQRTIRGFSERTALYSETEQDVLYQQMVLYNGRLYKSGQEQLVDAFSYETVDFSLKEFGFAEEMAASLSIPRLDLELPVYLGADKENLRLGAAHLTQTSLPVGGVNTNAVIAAHRGMSGAKMFRHIDQLEIGDMIYVTNFRETLTYQVAEISIIKPDEINRILIQPGRDLVTLISCNPYGYNYERYVVYGERLFSE